MNEAAKQLRQIRKMLEWARQSEIDVDQAAALFDLCQALELSEDETRQVIGPDWAGEFAAPDLAALARAQGQLALL